MQISVNNYFKLIKFYYYQFLSSNLVCQSYYHNNLFQNKYPNHKKMATTLRLNLILILTFFIMVSHAQKDSQAIEAKLIQILTKIHQD